LVAGVNRDAWTRAFGVGQWPARTAQGKVQAIFEPGSGIAGHGGLRATLHDTHRNSGSLAVGDGAYRYNGGQRYDGFFSCCVSFAVLGHFGVGAKRW
jgi:hypothetical protein